jgi:hypothetical protein
MEVSIEQLKMEKGYGREGEVRGEEHEECSAGWRRQAALTEEETCK